MRCITLYIERILSGCSPFVHVHQPLKLKVCALCILTTSNTAIIFEHNRLNFYNSNFKAYDPPKWTVNSSDLQARELENENGYTFILVTRFIFAYLFYNFLSIQKCPIYLLPSLKMHQK